ncbi:hypothetical protein C1H76_6561 [Elsinoe australis]|uniref:Beta-lactamase-related domain-containing protein n=1 Tax=Elsinoe australis TaxID=40998 RepID=A0A4U7AW82_9PEZI|nr:hypothetical protein C1H76_6561 [Elsinoe australis]
MIYLSLALLSLLTVSNQGCLPQTFGDDDQTGCLAQQIPLTDDSDYDKYEPFTSEFNTYVEDIIDQWNTPGLAISVVHGQDTFAKGYGYADVESKEPVTPFTLFQGASTTKSFTASLAALLVQDNGTFKDIKWDSKLHEIQPDDFSLADSYRYESSEVTFLDALSHRTGLPRHDFAWVNTNLTIKQQTQVLKHVPLSASFRTKWQYCNLMFTAVANAIETLTGKPAAQIYKSWLWDPLGMKQTYASVEDAETCKQSNHACIHASQYSFTNKSAGYVKIPLKQNPEINGAGGVISNVHDYAKWVRALMTMTGPVSKAGHEALRQPLSFVSAYDDFPYDGTTTYGMGMFSATYRGKRVYYHNGAIGGFWSRFTFFPGLDWGFTVMQNAPNFSVDIVAWRLMMDFLNVPKEDRVDINKLYWDGLEKHMRDTKAKPKELYPSVPSPPILPSLAPNEYTGTYSHPGYGNITLVLGYPEGAHLKQTQWLEPPTTVVMYLKTHLLGVYEVFHHVSGDHWLVEEQWADTYNGDVPISFTKARTQIGPDGKVDSIHIIIEPDVEGDEGWAKFVKIA